MKLAIYKLKRAAAFERGSAVLVLLAFLSIIILLCAATSRTLWSTRREVALIEQHQLARLAATTNRPPASVVTVNSQAPQ